MNTRYSKTLTDYDSNEIKINNRICTGRTIQKALFTAYQFYLEIKEKQE